MPRKVRCPQCGSSKIIQMGNIVKCKTCSYEGSKFSRKGRSKKGKVRF